MIAYITYIYSQKKCKKMQKDAKNRNIKIRMFLLKIISLYNKQIGNIIK